MSEEESDAKMVSNGVSEDPKKAEKITVVWGDLVDVNNQ
jgi:hypothetical protein